MLRLVLIQLLHLGGSKGREVSETCILRRKLQVIYRQRINSRAAQYLTGTPQRCQCVIIIQEVTEAERLRGGTTDGWNSTRQWHMPNKLGNSKD